MKYEYRSNWVELTIRKTHTAFKVAPAGYYDNRAQVHVAFLFFSLFFNLPIRSKYNECEPPEYGFHTYHNDPKKLFESFWLCLGKKRKCFYMPWSWAWVRTSVLLSNGRWVHELIGKRQDFWKDEWKDRLMTEIHPYKYTLKSGEVQNVMATVTTEEREWRWRWFKWSSFPRLIRRTIAVEFSDEVGERKGSWKGGTVGCSYNLRKGETMLECLRRMESERKFR